MSSYRIHVNNNSGAPRTYFLFIAAPDVSGGAQVFQDVYLSAPTVASGKGNATFTVKTPYFAICGTSPGRQLGDKVECSIGDWGVAKLNEQGRKESSFVMTGAPGNAAAFDRNLTGLSCDQPGSFSVESRNFLPGNGC